MRELELLRRALLLASIMLDPRQVGRYISPHNPESKGLDNIEGWELDSRNLANLIKIEPQWDKTRTFLEHAVGFLNPVGASRLLRYAGNILEASNAFSAAHVLGYRILQVLNLVDKVKKRAKIAIAVGAAVTGLPRLGWELSKIVDSSVAKSIVRLIEAALKALEDVKLDADLLEPGNERARRDARRALGRMLKAEHVAATRLRRQLIRDCGFHIRANGPGWLPAVPFWTEIKVQWTEIQEILGIAD